MRRPEWSESGKWYTWYKGLPSRQRRWAIHLILYLVIDIAPDIKDCPADREDGLYIQSCTWYMILHVPTACTYCMYLVHDIACTWYMILHTSILHTSDKKKLGAGCWPQLCYTRLSNQIAKFPQKCFHAQNKTHISMLTLMHTHTNLYSNTYMHNVILTWFI